MRVRAFDVEKILDEEIAPLMDQVHELCKLAQIPMLASFCYKYNPGKNDNDEIMNYCNWTCNRHDWAPEELNQAYLIVTQGASGDNTLAMGDFNAN